MTTSTTCLLSTASRPVGQVHSDTAASARTRRHDTHPVRHPDTIATDSLWKPMVAALVFQADETRETDETIAETPTRGARKRSGA